MPQALELADAAAAGGLRGADKAWRASFVTALKAAAIRGVVHAQAGGGAAAAAAAAAAGGGGTGVSQQGDKRR
jgi:hypothetical protein